MAYDRELKEKIDGMGAGDLVHFMLTKHENAYEDIHLQPIEYFWAYERLNELLPGSLKEGGE